MKKSVFLLLLGVLLAASCKIELNSGNRIEPSRNIVKSEHRLKPFDKLEVDVVANVKFIQSSDSSCRVVLSCPENYADLFSFGQDGDGELEIEFTRGNVNIEARNVDITVYAPALTKLENSGVANVEIDRLRGDRLKVENSGVGGIYISGLAVTDVDAECSGVGSVELGGETVRADLDCSGVGSIRAAGLKARAVRAEVSGVGGISCHASERIEGEVSGVGSLEYGGRPKEKSLNRSGVGKISEL